MTREEVVFEYLQSQDIPYECYHHPEGKTIAEAMQAIVEAQEPPKPVGRPKKSTK